MYQLTKPLPFKPILWIVALVFGLSLLYLAFGDRSVHPPTLLSTSPADQSINVPLQKDLEFNFSSVISAPDFTVTSTPPASWDLDLAGTSTLLVSPRSALSPTTKYSLILAWKTTLLTTLSFETIASQTDTELIKNIKDEAKRDYPLAPYLPYQTSLYDVSYLAPRVLVINLKNPNLTSEEVIDEVKLWVASKLGSVESHEYSVVTSP